MYINSRHIKIAKFLSIIGDSDLEILKKSLDITSSTLNAYLRDIEFILTEKNDIKSYKDIIILIKSKPNLIWLLKKNQNITKTEKIDFMISMFLYNQKVNLTEAAALLDINRRSINYYLEEMNSLLNKNNLFLTNKNNCGLVLDGDLKNRKDLIFGYTYKLLIEKNELPKNLRNIVAYIIKSLNLNEFKLLFKNIDFGKCISNKDSIVFIAFYFSHYFLENKKVTCFESFYKELHEYIKDNVNKTHYNEFKELIQKYLNINLQNQIVNDFHILKWFWYNQMKDNFNITDLNRFLIITDTIPNEIKTFVINMKNNFKSFSLYEGINLYFTLKNSHFVKNEQKHRDIFVYRSLSQEMIFSAEVKLKKNYSFDFKEVLNVNEVKKYLNSNKVDSIVTIENFKIQRYISKNIKDEQLIYIPIHNLL
ncbi:MAG: hypothetical protein ACRCZR_08825 [Cetobacterium sp.]